MRRNVLQTGYGLPFAAWLIVLLGLACSSKKPPVARPLPPPPPPTNASTSPPRSTAKAAGTDGRAESPFPPSRSGTMPSVRLRSTT